MASTAAALSPEAAGRAGAAAGGTAAGGTAGEAPAGPAPGGDALAGAAPVAAGATRGAWLRDTAGALRGRRVVALGLTPEPTSTDWRSSSLGARVPWIPGSAPPSAGGGGTRSALVLPRGGGGWPGAGALPASGPTSTEMMGVPTSAVVPSGTSSPATTPSYGEGSSTTALAVSISTMIWLIVTRSPGCTCHLMMSASVRPSPTSGSRNCLSSDMRPPQ